MKSFRTIRKNAKALSPVVASIILIAVTVAVSVAVAAWMGGMTIGFMGTSSVTVTNVAFNPATTTDASNITLSLKNTGTKTATLASVKVNNIAVPFAPSGGNSTATSSAIPAGLTFTITLSQTWVDGNTYKIDLFDGSNQVVGSVQQNAPGA